MDIAAAQSEIRRAYLRGGPGAIISGMVWLAGGILASSSGVSAGFAVLFFGGMLIFPLAAFFVRVVFRRAPVSATNPGGLTVIETVFPMMGGLLAAWLFIPLRPEFVFPMAAIAVGAHYFGFRTAYGDWTNWLLGGLLSSTGLASIFFGVPAANIVPYLVAAMEFAFGCWFIWISVMRD